MIHAEIMMEEPRSTKIPTPPSSRPSSLRRPRTRYVSKILNQNPVNQDLPVLFQEATIDKTENEMNLQKYKILPAIGSCSDLRTEPESDSKKFEKTNGRDNGSRNNSGTSHGKGDSGKLNRDVLGNDKDVLDKQYSQISTSCGDISKSPSSVRNIDEQQVEIAIRLPDGSRHENCFSISSTFMDLLEFLISSSISDEIIARNSEFVTSEVPRQVFSDFNVTLHEAKIKTRTLLYLREVDPD